MTLLAILALILIERCFGTTLEIGKGHSFLIASGESLRFDVDVVGYVQVQAKVSVSSRYLAKVDLSWEDERLIGRRLMDTEVSKVSSGSRIVVKITSGIPSNTIIAHIVIERVYFYFFTPSIAKLFLYCTCILTITLSVGPKLLHSLLTPKGIQKLK